MPNILRKIWIPIGFPGYLGINSIEISQLLNNRLGKNNWRFSHVVNGLVVSKHDAIKEYEKSYQLHFERNPLILNFLISGFGNIYDYDINNVYDDQYFLETNTRHHYHDVAIRRIVSKMPWSGKDIISSNKILRMLDLSSGKYVKAPQAVGFSGKRLLQVRGPESPGFFLSPAIVPFHNPSWIVINPLMKDWYLKEGCGHYSIEAFWQTTKILEVRLNKYSQMTEADRYTLYRNLKISPANPLND